MFENKIDEVDPGNTFYALRNKGELTESQEFAAWCLHEQIGAFLGWRANAQREARRAEREIARFAPWLLEERKDSPLDQLDISTGPTKVFVLEDQARLSASLLADACVNELKTNAEDLVNADQVLLLRHNVTEMLANDTDREIFRKRSVIVLDGLFEECHTTADLYRETTPAAAMNAIITGLSWRDTLLIITTPFDLIVDMGGLLYRHDPSGRSFDKMLEIRKGSPFDGVRITS